MLDIAARTISSEENKQIHQFAETERQRAFFNCWTRKEAFIKAIGDGVSFPLDQFDVFLRPGIPARILRIFGSEEKAERWSMHELRSAEGYFTALVVEATNPSITFQEWKFDECVEIAQEPR